MSDLEVLRTRLDEGAAYGPHTSARIGEFVARFSFATSDFGMPSAERKALVAASVSPELCKITEDAVLSEPYVEHEHDHWDPASTTWPPPSARTPGCAPRSPTSATLS
nr:hypothetical protein [Streptomyces sp. LUP30]